MVNQDSVNWRGESIRPVGVKVFNVAALKALAATTNYTQYDVMSESASAGTVWTFDLSAYGFPEGGSGDILGAIIYKKNTQATHLSRMKFYNTSTLSANLNDNAQDTSPHASDMFSGTTPKVSYFGKVDFSALSKKGSGGTEGQARQGDGDLPIPFKCASGDAKIYGILIDMSGETSEVASDECIIILNIRQD